MRKIKWFIPCNTESNTDLLLFSACDSSYLKYAISLIKSVDSFSPGSNFILHVVNPDKTVEERINLLVSSLKQTQLAVSFENIDLQLLREEQRIAYYACARFPQLAKLLEESHCPIFSIDADSLVVNPIDLDFSNKVDAEIVLVRRDLVEDVQEHLAIATGSIWLKPSEGVRRFMQQLASKIDDEVRGCILQWFVDQIAFYQQIQIMNKEVKIYNLKRKYADWDFKECSIVWAGKGDRKDNDMRFFLLQGLLSDDFQNHEFSKSLKSYLFSSGRNTKHSPWLLERLEVAINGENFSKDREQMVDLYLPRLDLPWKQDMGSQDVTPLLSDDVLELRIYWKKFTIRLANAIERAGMSVNVIELPAWKINRKKIENSIAKIALIPHRCHLDFDEGDMPVMFYMQEYFRSVFVLDEKGWSAASSIYPVDMEVSSKATYNSFDIYQQRLQSGELGSKFSQTLRQSCEKLVRSGNIPSSKSWLGLRKKKPYIFFPLQIPHDQSIRYFSDVSEIAIVERMVSWAKVNNIAVVMKPHPANPKSMLPFKEFVDGHDVFWSEAHVYDLINYSTGVYTLNSGVGFEALLHCKPVITFGRAEYDSVTFHGTIDNFNEAWTYCLTFDSKELEFRYRQFVDWFLGDYAVDLSQPEQAIARLDSIAENIVLRSKKRT